MRQNQYYDYIVPRGPIPNITSVNPGIGPDAGGTAISIHGTGFAAGAVVYMNGVLCTSIVVVSAILITCVTPASVKGGPATLFVMNPSSAASGASGNGLFVYAPIITSVTPNNGIFSGGTDVITAGSGFATGATVTFGGANATAVMVVSDSEVTCKTPAHIDGLVNVVLTNLDTQTSGTSGNGKYTYVSALQPPDIVSITPNSGSSAGGTAITNLRGTDFQNGATVFFNGVPATSVVWVSGAKLTCVAPAGTPGSADILVVNPDGQDSSTSGDGLYTYVAPPVVTSVTPNTGADAGGTAITNLAGTGFQPGATVFFDAAPATSVVWVSATEITCTTPAGAIGLADVLVVNPDGQDSGTSGNGSYTYTSSVLPPPPLFATKAWTYYYESVDLVYTSPAVTATLPGRASAGSSGLAARLLASLSNPSPFPGTPINGIVPISFIAQSLAGGTGVFQEPANAPVPGLGIFTAIMGLRWNNFVGSPNDPAFAWNNSGFFSDWGQNRWNLGSFRSGFVQAQTFSGGVELVQTANVDGAFAIYGMRSGGVGTPIEIVVGRPDPILNPWISGAVLGAGFMPSAATPNYGRASNPGNLNRTFNGDGGFFACDMASRYSDADYLALYNAQATRWGL